MLKNKNVHTFSRSSLELYVVRYAAIILAIGVCIVYTVDKLGEFSVEDAKRLLVLMVFFVLLYYITNLLSKKFVYKIIVDVAHNQISFYMFKKDNVLKTTIGDIKKIYVNFYITFFLDGKKLVYKGVEDNQLIDLVKGQAQTQTVWGSYGKWLQKKRV